MIVKEGDDAILPCFFNANRNIESVPFNWKKEGPGGQKKVFLYDPGNNSHSQHDQSDDRVSHFPNELKHGNASITIKNTKLTDTGKYTCNFPNLQSERKTEILLLVGECSHNPPPPIFH